MSLRNSCSESVVTSGFRSSGALAAPALVRGALHLVGDGRGRIDLLDQLDLRSLEQRVQLLDVGLIDVEPGRGRRDLSVGEHADPLALGNQALYLFEFLQLDY